MSDTANAEYSSRLSPINEAGDRLPLFVLHTAPIFISKALGPTQPVYFFRGLWKEGTRPARINFKQVAAGYVKQVKEIPSKGPYQLTDGSIGGMMAYEMARQLLENVDEVGLLFLIEPITPVKFGGGIRRSASNRYLWFLRAGKAAIRSLFPTPDPDSSHTPKWPKNKLVTHTYLGRMLVCSSMLGALNAESRPYSVFREAYVCALYEMGAWTYVADPLPVNGGAFKVRKGPPSTWKYGTSC